MVVRSVSKTRTWMSRAFVVCAVVSVLLGSDVTHAAVFTVTSTDDTEDCVCDADCTLWDALCEANYVTPGSQIIVPAGVYAAPYNYEINESVTITGAGANETVIEAQQSGGFPVADSVLYFDNNSSDIHVQLSGLTIQGAYTGLYIRRLGDFGTLTVSNCILRGAPDSGGDGGNGIVVDQGNLAVMGSVISGFVLGIEASGYYETFINVEGSEIRDNGEGGILFEGDEGSALAVTTTTITGNGITGPYTSGYSFSGLGGIAVLGFVSNASIANSTFSGNRGDSGGGMHFGVWSGVTLTVTVEDSTITANTASDEGGGIYFNGSGTLTIQDSTISDNTAEYGEGGGVYFEGYDNDMSTSTLTVENSTISGNTAGDDGGGIWFINFSYETSGVMTLDNSTVSGNTGQFVGGVWAGSPAALRNCTISGNTGAGTSSAAGAYLESGTINNCTITGNTATDPDTVGGLDGTFPLVLSNTIVAANSPWNCFWSPIVSDGYNMDDDGSCQFDAVGDLSDVAAANLAPLGNYGGATQTHALCEGVGVPHVACAGPSPALDAGNPATPGSGGNTCEAIDQRGVTRPVGPVCDMGAYETGGGCTGPDTDGDGICDEDDACTNVADGQDLSIKPRVFLGKINSDTDPSNDTLKVLGEFILPGGTSFAMLDPETNGARVLLTNAVGSTIADVTLAAGAYAGRGTRGWLKNRKGTKWTFVDKTGMPANGIVKLVAQDRSSKAPNRVKVNVIGKGGSYPVTPGDAPVKAAVVLGAQGSSDAGECTETAFTSSDCAFNGSGNKLTCKQ
jgi:parallel beta-helix repeat protein